MLIIGILAAIAVPQYQFAVEKSRAAQAFVNLKALSDASDRFFLETNAWPTTFDQLDITIGNNCGLTCPVGDFTYRLELISSYGYIMAYRGSASTANLTICIMMQDETVSAVQLHKGDMICAPRANEKNQRICRALGGKTMHENGSSFLTASPFFILGQ